MKLHLFSEKKIINTWNASWIILISTSSRVGYPDLGISGIPKRPQRSNASVLSFKALSNNSLIWNETLKLLHLIIFWPPFFYTFTLSCLDASHNDWNLDCLICNICKALAIFLFLVFSSWTESSRKFWSSSSTSPIGNVKYNNNFNFSHSKIQRQL